MSESSCRFDAGAIISAADRIVRAIRSASREQRIILELLLKLILDIEVIKMNSEILIGEHVHKELQRKFTAALGRYTGLYVAIIREFTDDIVKNLEHFIKLAKENLAPLRKIVKSMKKLLEEIESINPIEEDRDLLNVAISMYDKRESIARTYLEHEQNICENIDKVKKSKQDFVDNLKNVLFPEIEIKNTKAILLIPIYIVKVKTKSGETKTVIVPLSQIAKYKDLLDRLFASKIISTVLRDKIELSIQNRKDIVKFRKPSNEAKKKAKEILCRIAKNKEEEKIIEEALR